MIRVLLRHPPQQPPATSVAAADAVAAWRSRRASVWLDVEDATPAELEGLAQDFGLYPTAILSAMTPDSRPRVQQHGRCVSLTLYVPPSGTPSGRPAGEDVRPGGRAGIAGLDEPLEVDFIVGERFLITVHRRPVALLARIAEHVRVGSPSMAEGIAGLLHHVVDEIVDAYFPLLDALLEASQQAHNLAFAGGDAPGRAGRTSAYGAMTLLRTRQALFALRRIMAAQSRALTILARTDLPLGEPARRGSESGFQDVLDHAIRLEQAIMLHHEMLTRARIAYTARLTNEAARVSKTLLLVTCLLISATLITSVYGMNFVNVPERAWPLGRLWALAIIFFTVGGLWLTFARRRWID
ncbi:MAG TPA: magnesium transporter CorA family protein [Chloroflexota bacterium]|nr:magnesium transporter CorA family protein [Chloroflexota bacterium]